MRDTLIQAFETHYKATASQIVRAPGRVNLVGEHTDYNDGFVLPMAIDRAAWIAIRPRDDHRVIVHSLDLDETLSFDLLDFSQGGAGWGEYIKGLSWALQAEGFALRGWEGFLAGDVPIGAGLSSSAALELATARAFSLASDFEWQPLKMALLAQKAENQWVGMNCGIMDQMASALGAQDHALQIDCRSLEYKLVPIPQDAVIVILDTMTRRGLVESAYNERRLECEAAAAQFEVSALRDVSMSDFEKRGPELDLLIRKRAKHIITENQRVLDSVTALEGGDLARFGALMNASHHSMRDDFEISSKELDLMVEIAQKEEGCLGARMTGGGFAGCAIALLNRKKADGFIRTVCNQYKDATGFEAEVYVSRGATGASVEQP